MLAQFFRKIGIVLIILSIFINSSSALASFGVKPGDIIFTELMVQEDVKWAELTNRTDRDLDVSGFKIESESDSYLYPEDSNAKFIIPADYVVVITDNIQKFNEANEVTGNVVLIEVQNLFLNQDKGSLTIKDQFDVEIDTASYSNTYDIFIEGYSIERFSATNGVEKNWFPSLDLGGNPGVISFSLTKNKTTKLDNESDSEVIITDLLIQKLNSTSLTATWSTSVLCKGALYYGESENDLEKVETNENISNFHTVTLTGLNPSTSYYLRSLVKYNNKLIASENLKKIYTYAEENNNTNLLPEIKLDYKSAEAKTTYDVYDAMFIKGLSSLQKIDKQIKEDSVGDSEKELSSVFSEGSYVAIVLASIFLLFFLIKYFFRIKEKFVENLN